MQLRTYLLQLVLTPGLGQQSQWRIYNWLTHHPEASLPLPCALVLEIVQPTPQYRAQIKQFYNQDTQLRQLQAELQRPFLTICDSQYPLLLKASHQPPLILFYQGDLRALNLPLVAMVGARQATRYAYDAIEMLLPPLQTAGIGIVSGLAKGVDTLVHQSYLNHGGVPIGVIGTGLDITYPASSRHLQAQVATNGLLLSEYPYGIGPKKHHFPARNRIIAGLCQATVVIEAAKNSGSLITANLALQENRNVLAVPGPINAPMSVGCNELIQVGAGCVTNASTIIQEIQI